MESSASPNVSKESNSLATSKEDVQQQTNNNNTSEVGGQDPVTQPPQPACSIRYSRIFKKVSQDGNLVLFLPQRELMVTENQVESLMGVALIHESVMRAKDIKVYLQVVLIFRYGREDEELMGLRFCNEIIVAAEQIYPTAIEEAVEEIKSTESSSGVVKERRNSLINSQGFFAVPFVVDMGNTAPPSIRLVPCRPYSGAPIGTSYEVQLFASHSPEELPRRRKMVQMSLRVYEKLPKELPPRSNVVLHKDYVFSDQPLMVSAKLDKGVYSQGEEINLILSIHRGDNQPHGVKKVKAMAVQQVGVAMFSSGNFKNNIGINKDIPRPDFRQSEYNEVIPIKIELSQEFAWAAMDETSKKESELTQLAPTVTHSNKALFVVRVTYFVQVQLVFGLLKRPIVLKLPFILKRVDPKTTTANSKLILKEECNHTAANPKRRSSK